MIGPRAQKLYQILNRQPSGSPEGSLFGLKLRKTRTRMQFVRISEGPAGRPGRVAEPAVGQLACGPKGSLFHQKRWKRCTRMPNVLIPEVPPAAAGRWEFLSA